MTVEELLVKFQEDISWLGYCETEREIVAHIKCAMALLKEQPDIIRCEYCIRRGTYDCPVHIGGHDDGYDEPDDWFCADGEPKEQLNRGEED